LRLLLFSRYFWFYSCLSDILEITLVYPIFLRLLLFIRYSWDYSCLSDILEITLVYPIFLSILLFIRYSWVYSCLSDILQIILVYPIFLRLLLFIFLLIASSRTSRLLVIDHIPGPGSLKLEYFSDVSHYFAIFLEKKNVIQLCISC